jgi:beta-phosphoglucomutase-like phosphatase (HAD superfamily)
LSPRLVLFDIDGTLLSAGRISARMFGEALLEAFGTVGDAASFDYSGKTDPQIVRELASPTGRSRPGDPRPWRTTASAWPRPFDPRTSPPSRVWRPSSTPSREGRR